MVKTIVSDSWKTKSLIVAKATIDDISDLEKVYQDGFKQSFIYQERSPQKGYIKSRVTKPFLPPKGKPENDQFQVIRTKAGKCIGYIGTYDGWPKKKSLWINDLFLLRSAQGNGYGKELVRALILLVKKSRSHKDLSCRVSLKNWSALQFWLQMGFTEIIGFEGDNTFSEKKSADLVLKRNI